MIRLLLADDHNIVREGICHVLGREQDITIIAQTDNGRSAVQLAIEHQPDVILMDMSMPKMNGVEATRLIASEAPACRVIMLSMHSDKHFVTQALNAGVNGYLVKGCDSDELLGAIRAVANGETHVCSKLVESVINSYVQQKENHPEPIAELTPREQEVLKLITGGNNTKEIAVSLGIGTKTVETYRQQLMKKLNIFNVAILTKYALREGVTSI